MKQEIFMLQGPPAGGKSTKARELYNEDKLHRVIVNRDSIRDSRGDYWVPEQEQYISKLEEFAVRSALESGLSPIIDATNLNQKTIKKWVDIASEYKVDLTTIECVVPYKEALVRDENRARPVGKKVLRDFYKRYYPQLIAPMSDDRKMIEFTGKKKAIIVDIDGTIALRQNRSPFEYEKVGEDKVDHRMAHLLRNLICECEEYEVFFVSGREQVGNCYADTALWLSNNIHEEHWFNQGVCESNWTLYMREEGDHRSDEIVKKEIYENKIKPWFDVVCVFDDRNRVVKMWRDLGLLCAQVYDGDF